jgi:hypothetical protein
MLGLSRAERTDKLEARARAKEIRTLLLRESGKTRATEEAKRAIAYCEMCIAEYEEWFEWNEARWLRWQKVTIIGGVVATLAGVVTIPASWLEWAPKDIGALSWLRGVPAAVATIAASYLGSFNYREDAVRHEVTSNALWNELAKFQARAEPYNLDDGEDTSAFTNRVCDLIETELHSWSALVRGNRQDGSSQPAEGATAASMPTSTPLPSESAETPTPEPK